MTATIFEPVRDDELLFDAWQRAQASGRVLAYRGSTAVIVAGPLPAGFRLARGPLTAPRAPEAA